MADADQGRAPGRSEQPTVKTCFARFVEGGCRFIEEEEIWFCQQDASKRETLLFAERQALGPVVNGIQFPGQLAESHLFKHLSECRRLSAALLIIWIKQRPGE